MKKWIKIVLGVVLAIVLVPVLALLALNLRADSNRLYSSVTIHQPPEAIWPWLYEPENLKAWVSWLKEVRRPPAGPPASGMQSVWVMEDRNNNNMLMEISTRVEAVEPGRRLDVRLESAGMFRGSTSYILTGLGNGETRLEMDSRYEMNNWFAKLMMPVVAMAAGQKAKGDLAHLQTLVEARR